MIAITGTFFQYLFQHDVSFTKPRNLIICDSQVDDMKPVSLSDIHTLSEIQKRGDEMQSITIGYDAIVSGYHVIDPKTLPYHLQPLGEF